jgi:uncharacterized membrane protein
MREMADEKETSSFAKEGDDPVISEGKFFAIVGYIFILCLVPLILKKDNKFALFHGKQGLVLFIFEFAGGILKWVPAVGDVVAVLAFVVCGILSLVGILKVLMNEYWEMPIVHDISEKITI